MPRATPFHFPPANMMFDVLPPDGERATKQRNEAHDFIMTPPCRRRRAQPVSFIDYYAFIAALTRRHFSCRFFFAAQTPRFAAIEDIFAARPRAAYKRPPCCCVLLQVVLPHIVFAAFFFCCASCRLSSGLVIAAAAPDLARQLSPSREDRCHATPCAI